MSRRRLAPRVRALGLGRERACGCGSAARGGCGRGPRASCPTGGSGVAAGRRAAGLPRRAAVSCFGQKVSSHGAARGSPAHRSGAAAGRSPWEVGAACRRSSRATCRARARDEATVAEGIEIDGRMSGRLSGRMSGSLSRASPSPARSPVPPRLQGFSRGQSEADSGTAAFFAPGCVAEARQQPPPPFPLSLATCPLASASHLPLSKPPLTILPAGRSCCATRIHGDLRWAVGWLVCDDRAARDSSPDVTPAQGTILQPPWSLHHQIAIDAIARDHQSELGVLASIREPGEMVWRCGGARWGRKELVRLKVRGW